MALGFGRASARVRVGVEIRVGGWGSWSTKVRRAKRWGPNPSSEPNPNPNAIPNPNQGASSETKGRAQSHAAACSACAVRKRLLENLPTSASQRASSMTSNVARHALRSGLGLRLGLVLGLGVGLGIGLGLGLGLVSPRLLGAPSRLVLQLAPAHPQVPEVGR